MVNFLTVIQILVSLFLVVLVLVQSGGSGMSKGSSRKSSFTRRGLDKMIFKTSFFVAALFIILSIVPLFLN